MEDQQNTSEPILVTIKTDEGECVVPALVLINLKRVTWETRNHLLQEIDAHVDAKRLDRKQLPSHDSSWLKDVIPEILASFEGTGLSAYKFHVQMILDELLVDALHHGNKRRVDKSVTVAHGVVEDQFLLHVGDQGGGFDIHRVPDPTLPETMGLPGGRGIILTDRFMEQIQGQGLALPVEPGSDKTNAWVLRMPAR